MNISGLPISSTVLGTAKSLVDPKITPAAKPPENIEPESTKPKTEATTVTLTSIKAMNREPKINFDNWQQNNNAPLFNKDGFNDVGAGAKAISGFSQAWVDYKDNPKIQGAIEKYDLKFKDWDFTIDKNGSIKVLEGKDKLSSQAVKDLENALNGSEFGYHFKDMAMGLIGKSQLSVNSHNNSNSMTKYDINTDNISGILRGRELMEQRRADWSDLEGTFSKQVDRAAEKLGLEEKVDLTYRRIQIEV